MFNCVEDASAERFENIVAHELHHIGFNAACSVSVSDDAPENVRAPSDWIGAFAKSGRKLPTWSRTSSTSSRSRS